MDVEQLMSVARDAKEAYLQRPRASISKPSSGAGAPNGAMRKATSGNDEVLLLGNSGFGKAKSIASTDGVAVLQQPLHRAIMEDQPSLSASVSYCCCHVTSPQCLVSRAREYCWSARSLEARPESRVTPGGQPCIHGGLGV